MGSVGGAGNTFGSDNFVLVNGVVFGFNGHMNHSNSVLFSYGHTGNGTQSQFTHEFRVRADNGAVFEHTPLRASALLVRDQISERENVTSLGTYLTLRGTNATAILSGFPTYRYRWSQDYSPEQRFRYGMVPAEVVSVDSNIGVVDQDVIIQLDDPALVNDTVSDVCSFENEPPSSTFISNDIDHGSIDLGSLVTLLTEAVKELNTRVAVLEATVTV